MVRLDVRRLHPGVGQRDRSEQPQRRGSREHLSLGRAEPQRDGGIMVRLLERLMSGASMKGRRITNGVAARTNPVFRRILFTLDKAGACGRRATGAQRQDRDWEVSMSARAEPDPRTTRVRRTTTPRIVIAMALIALVALLAAASAIASTQYGALTCCGNTIVAGELHTQSITTVASGSGTWMTGFFHGGFYFITCSNNCSVNASFFGFGSGYPACSSDSPPGAGSYWVSCRYP